MDAKQLKRDLEKYAGYKYSSNNRDMKVIEESIFEGISNYLRPVTKDVFGNPINSSNISEDLRKESVLKHFELIKQVSEDYFSDELVVYLLDRAHNDWILAHKEELEKMEIRNPEKFAPFPFITNESFNEYLNVLTPIFKCLDIKFDKGEVETAFARKQLVFMLKNEIFIGDDLKEKIMNIKETYPEILEVATGKSTRIQDLYAIEDVAEIISESVNQKIHLNFADKFKEVFLNDNKVGFFSVTNSKQDKNVYKFFDSLGQKKIGFKKHGLPRPGKPVTEAVFKLARLGNAFFAKNVKISDYKYGEYSVNSNQFLTYDKCNEEQKRAIDKREKSLKKFIDNIDFNNDADIPGVISLVVVRQEPECFLKEYMNNDNEKKKKEIIQIPITQRELAKMRILPEEVGWEKEKKAIIHSSDKAVFVSSDKRLKQRKDFINFLTEMAQCETYTESKITMDDIKSVYQCNLNKNNENEFEL